MEHLGGLRDFELLPIEGMADPWRYRNRADFSIGDDEERGVAIGFKLPGRWDTILPISECHLLDPGIERARAIVEEWLREQGLPGWNPRRNEGFARHLLVRSAQKGAELLVSLVTVPGELPGVERLIERLRAELPQLVGFVHSINSGPAELSAGLEGTTLWGRPHLFEKVAGITLKISVNAFFQTNSRQTEVLYGLAAREVTAAAPSRGEAPGPGAGAAEAGGATRPVIWDLYSGVGSIGLSLAGHAAAVLGIEAIADAVEDAKDNARLNGIENAHFLEGDVAKVLRAVAEGSTRVTGGRRQTGRHRGRPAPGRPHRQGHHPHRRDRGPAHRLRLLQPGHHGPERREVPGVRLPSDRVTPVDMFPHTPHVECVGLLSRDSLRPVRGASGRY